jgi:hypothetical protein
MEGKAMDKGFQGKCFKATEGWLHMKSAFDRFPYSVRERLREVPENLCCACVVDVARQITYGRQPTEADYDRAIDEMLCKLGFKVTLTPKLAAIIAKRKPRRRLEGIEKLDW